MSSPPTKEESRIKDYSRLAHSHVTYQCLYQLQTGSHIYINVGLGLSYFPGMPRFACVLQECVCNVLEGQSNKVVQVETHQVTLIMV